MWYDEYHSDTKLEVYEDHTLLIYTEDIIIMGDTKQDIANSTSDLMEAYGFIGIPGEDQICVHV